MNRKILALILALAVVAAAIVLAVTLSKDPADGDVSGGRPSMGEKETAPAPGVEQGGIHAEPVETTEPAAFDHTIPTGPADPEADLQHPSAGLPEDTTPVQTEPDVTEPEVTEPEMTEPQQTQPTQSAEPTQSTEPAQPTQPTESASEGELDYETFTAMDPAEQRVYMESFESLDAFFAWYNAAKEAYEQEHPAIDVGDGVVDLGGLGG